MFTNVALPQVENSSALMTLLLQACRQDFGSSASCPIFYGSQELPVRQSTLENRGAAVYITRGCRRILEAEDGICRLYHAAIRAIPTCSFEIKHTF
ncbi:uncharacterized protein LOC124417626 isoform X4 [Gallus gallus]|nr:uncharacterized protein LOC124417626 isoform X4 [Gallus gallus]